MAKKKTLDEKYQEARQKFRVEPSDENRKKFLSIRKEILAETSKN